MDSQVTLRPVIEDDLSWLDRLRNDPDATGLHEWHGWSDPRSRQRRWAESGLLGDSGGELISLPSDEQTDLMKTFSSVGADVSKTKPLLDEAYKIVTDAAQRTAH